MIGREGNFHIHYELACLLLAALVLAVLFLRNGYCQFLGWDAGYLTEAAYRQSLGQTPNVDFHCRMPLDFYLAGKAAFHFFGIHWGSLVWFGIIVATLGLFWMHALLRALRFTAAQALFFSFTLAAMLWLGRSYYWYNPSVSQAVICLFLSTIVAIRRPGYVSTWFSFSLAAMWVMAAKPNGYGMLLFCLLAVACCGWRAALRVCLAYLVAAGALWLVGYVSHTPMWPNVYECLAAAVARVRSFAASPFVHDATATEIVLRTARRSSAYRSGCWPQSPAHGVSETWWQIGKRLGLN